MHLALSAPTAETEVSWCGATRFAARLRASHMMIARLRTTVVHGEYAITGGLGGLGLRAASMLVDSGVSRVLLASRSGHVVRDGQGLEVQLQSMGGLAVVLTCDSAAPCDVISLLSANGLLTGVLHAAGAGNKVPLVELAMQRGQWMHVSKAAGVWYLDCTAVASSLERRVLFSSVGSSLGNVGQANYAAANACLDAHALSQRAHGVPACSLQCPVMGASYIITNALFPESISLERLVNAQLASSPPGVIQSVLLAHLGDITDRSESRFNELFDASTFPSADITTDKRDWDSDASSDDVLNFLMSEIKQLTPSEAMMELQADMPLQLLGLDSLAVGALSGATRRKFSISFAMAEALDGELTIRALAASISERTMAAMSRIHGSHSPGEANASTGAHLHCGPLFGKVPLSQTRIAQGLADSNDLPKIEIPMIFVFNTPRSGSTLFQLILNTHSSLWATKEFHILPFHDIGEWRQWMRGTVYEEPLIGGVHELMEEAASLDDARQFVDAWTNDMPIRDVYLHLQEQAAPVLVVRVHISSHANSILRAAPTCNLTARLRIHTS